MSTFRAPDFSMGAVEFRCGEDEVAVYGTREGLMRLARLCEELAGSRATSDHLHLEDYGILTSQSLRAVIGVFTKEASD